MKKNFKNNAQGGFTLIELIVVIVILGILAATAMPKFMDMGKEARTASLQAAKGSMASAVAMSYAQGLAQNGVGTYPLASALAEAAGLSNQDYTLTAVAGTPATTGADPKPATAGSLTVSPKGAATVATCSAKYTEGSMEIVLAVGGC